MAPSPSLAIARVLLRVLPDTVHRQVLAVIANHALRGQRVAARLSELDGCTICLDIHDTGSRLHFQIHNGRLVSVPVRAATVQIRGALSDFVDLAVRAEDPDTLFFQRRLSIEGDVETGLHVKNLVDSLDYDFDAHLRDVLPAVLADRAIGLNRWLRAVLASRRA